jgi:hypothetical protein
MIRDRSAGGSGYHRGEAIDRGNLAAYMLLSPAGSPQWKPQYGRRRVRRANAVNHFHPDRYSYRNQLEHATFPTARRPR